MVRGWLGCGGTGALPFFTSVRSDRPCGLFLVSSWGDDDFVPRRRDEVTPKRQPPEPFMPGYVPVQVD